MKTTLLNNFFKKRVFCWLSASVPSQDTNNDVEIIKSPTWTTVLSKLPGSMPS